MEAIQTPGVYGAVLGSVAENLRLLLELSTIVTAVVVRLATHFVEAADGDDGGIGTIFTEGFGDVSFLLMFGTVMAQFAIKKYGRDGCTGETYGQVQRAISATRMLSVFPFALAALLYMMRTGTGWVQLVGVLASIWVILYMLHLALTPVLEVIIRRRHLDQQQVVDETRGLELMRQGRRVVPGDARLSSRVADGLERVADGLEAAEPPLLPRSCSLCLDALPNTRCRPCGHSAACESCLLRWVSVTPQRCRCPVCSRDIFGYDVATEPGEYFLDTFVEEGGSSEEEAKVNGS